MTNWKEKNELLTLKHELKKIIREWEGEIEKQIEIRDTVIENKLGNGINIAIAVKLAVMTEHLEKLKKVLENIERD